MLREARGTNLTEDASDRVRTALRWLLAAFYGVAALFHFAQPGPFVSITPRWVPLPQEVVLFTGLAELAGALALVQPWSRPWRRAAGIGLALYAVCVFPANINHAINDIAIGGMDMSWWYHGPRLIAQPLIIWWALWVGEATDWPFGAKL